jgi:hypothetical protein
VLWDATQPLTHLLRVQVDELCSNFGPDGKNEVRGKPHRSLLEPLCEVQEVHNTRRMCAKGPQQSVRKDDDDSRADAS